MRLQGLFYRKKLRNRIFSMAKRNIKLLSSMGKLGQKEERIDFISKKIVKKIDEYITENNYLILILDKQDGEDIRKIIKEILTKHY
jgi:hypothetical protein